MEQIRDFAPHVTTPSAHDMGAARTMHQIDASRWTGVPSSAFWCEWNHPQEGSRTLSEMVTQLEGQNWARLIVPGSVCIDIGAHSGDTAIPMGLFSFDKIRGRQGAVYAVEPNPHLKDIIGINLALNGGIARFSHAPYAITASDIDSVELADHGNSNCNGGILDGGFSDALDQQLRDAAVFKYNARGVSLGTLLREMPEDDARNVRFIKTDCEGYDKEILRNSKEAIQQIKPAMYVEWFAWFNSDDSDDLFSAIGEIGYEAFNPFNMNPIDRSIDRTHDLICLPKK